MCISHPHFTVVSCFLDFVFVFLLGKGGEGNMVVLPHFSMQSHKLVVPRKMVLLFNFDISVMLPKRSILLGY